VVAAAVDTLTAARPAMTAVAVNPSTSEGELPDM
jgi:hypothetical protein